jgi:Arm domain-containing DNA-binding protein
MLTDTKARNAKPQGKPYKLTDGNGLYFHVTPAGGKIWRVRYEKEGKEYLLTVGPYPAVALAEARVAREDIAGRSRSPSRTQARVG